ncbi:2,3-bisphosphoglycerate-independent phosphoglycerate mutase [Desulfovibrio litoralis]|uniref:2,3-bisphosphoglycerate-independent phosphoglycerate mutase n=1 Tax=Desulfovibrio litoralis DSM 11393 TaxID=1121455 RepID=A0A1M7T8F7_9BACT|nr:2,3-bisphosphoglycerate-independent phosphoglycerate mutase [Desulfovibrio litoralis]SHN66998.1 phosphoglycerate mutase [Desulfovibrio litoralis DSM 11393]
MNNQYIPTILLILDGWGVADSGSGNAISLANVPNMKKVLNYQAQTRLECSGRAVGLPLGYMGNSEVGHMNIGSGRVVYQDMTKIDMAIEKHELEKNEVLLKLLEDAKKGSKRIHFCGLLSDSGVHSHIDHLFALIKIARNADLEVLIDCFMDGRDAEPTSGVVYMQKLLDWIKQNNFQDKVHIASLIGRYYAMDRDKRWERTQIAWDCLVEAKAELISDPVKALKSAYANGETDEFIKPRILNPEYKISNGDAVFFFNFRADRVRQITAAFKAENFTGFDLKNSRPNINLATMTAYDASLPLPAAFVKQPLNNTLGELVSKMGLKQLRVAETEKYAHVTYFFNAGKEEPFVGEKRILINSPRDVATYDLKPEMSAYEVTDSLIKEWEKGEASLYVCNLANCDMVGHTGIIPAAIKACEAVDACLGKIIDAVAATGGRLMITADHGNIEELLTPEGNPQTAHTKNPVPFILMEFDKNHQLLPPRKMVNSGKLGDIAVTILKLWGASVPSEMDGNSLTEEV